MKTYAVIGSNYGDEGKGLIVDRLVHDHSLPLVVRSNGGAQAGHTVHTPDGRRHIFHHVGAGNFAGASTYLSRFFVCNPTLFHTEADALAQLRALKSIAVDPRCLVTTPWDMILNQALETARGAGRHGSCGVGFNETIERSTDAKTSLKVQDLERPELPEHVVRIRDYVLQQYRTRIGPVAPNHYEYFYHDDLLLHWVDEARRFLDRIVVVPQQSLATQVDAIVFEGAQGLALDMDNRAGFPHLTRSNTGVKNPLRIAEELGARSLEVIYVTRSYLTRHGAGPLPNEMLRLPFRIQADRTNVDHPFQGPLRLGLLDMAALHRRVDADRTLMTNSAVRCQTGMAITHLDVEGEILFFKQQELLCHTKLDFATVVAAGMELEYISFGPRRSDVQPLCAALV